MNFMLEEVKVIGERLKQAKIKEFDIYLVKEDIHEHQYLKDEVQIIKDATTLEYFLRILDQTEEETGVGIVQSNSLNPQQIDFIIQTAVTLSKRNKSSKYALPAGDHNYFTQELAEKRIKNAPNDVLEEKSDDLLNEIALQKKKVTPTFGRLRLHRRIINLCSSNGLDLDSEKTFSYLELSLKCQEKGKLAEYWGKGYYKQLDQLNFSELIPEWTKFSRDSLNASHPSPKKDIVVLFPPKVLQEALNPVLGFHASGRAFHEKMSRFSIDQKVAVEDFSLIDNGLLKNGLKTGSWDGEGIPRQETTLIKEGIFKNRIYDQKYALLEKTNSTGNGLRTSVGNVVNGPTNLVIPPGTLTREEILQDIKEGLYVEEFSWLNPSEVTGMFGAEIRLAYEIQDGKIKAPIKGGNLAGNVLDMINHIKHVSKERKLVGNVLFPFITFENLVLSV